MKLDQSMLQVLEISKTNKFRINIGCFHGNMTISKWPHFYILFSVFQVSFGESF